MTAGIGVTAAGAVGLGPMELEDVGGLHAAEAALELPLYRDAQHQKQGQGGDAGWSDDSEDGGGGGAGGGIEEGAGGQTAVICRVVGHRNHSFPVHCAKVREGGGSDDIVHRLCGPPPPHTLFTLSAPSGSPRYEAPLLPRALWAPPNPHTVHTSCPLRTCPV